MNVCAFLTDGFETVEALAVVDILRRADIKTDMISITGDINVKSAQGVIVQADELLDEYVFEGDELLFLPGGPGHKSYYDCKDLLELLKEYNITTSRGMGTSLDLGLELVRLIKGEELAEQLRTSTQYI